MLPKPRSTICFFLSSEPSTQRLPTFWVGVALVCPGGLSKMIVRLHAERFGGRQTLPVLQRSEIRGELEAGRGASQSSGSFTNYRT